MSRLAELRMTTQTEVRDLGQMARPNDGTRSLADSIACRNVIAALDDWRQVGDGGLLIGQLAYNHYCKPRFADEVEFLVRSEIGVYDPPGFEGTGMFRRRHTATRTLMWFLIPKMFTVVPPMLEYILGSTIWSDGIEIASPSALVALSLHNHQHNLRPQAIHLLRLGLVDLSGCPLSDVHRQRLAQYQAEADAKNRRAGELEAQTGDPYP